MFVTETFLRQDAQCKMFTTNEKAVVKWLHCNKKKLKWMMLSINATFLLVAIGKSKS